jgi:hypothetical protein
MSSNSSSRPKLFRATLIALLFFSIAFAGGYFASQYLPHKVIAPLLKYAIGVVGVVWFISLTVYNKLSEVTDISGLDYHQHRNIEIEIRARLHWFWLRAIFLGLLALTMYAPTILNDAEISIPDWVIGIASGAFALALFSLRRLWKELEEIRELKSYVKEIERRENERADHLKLLKDEKEEWKPDPLLDGFRDTSIHS